MTGVRLAPRLSQQSVPRAAALPSGQVRAASKQVDGFERPKAAGAPSLQRGSTGPAVRALQDRLVKAGFLKAADVATGPGVYGPRTEAAVKRFQQAVGIPATGVAGASTHAALASSFQAGAKQKQPSRSIQDTPTNPMLEAAVNGRLASAQETFTDEETTPMGAPASID